MEARESLGREPVAVGAEICFLVIAKAGRRYGRSSYEAFAQPRSYVGTFALHNLLAAFRSCIRIRDGYDSRDIVHLLLKPLPSFGYFQPIARFPGSSWKPARSPGETISAKLAAMLLSLTLALSLSLSNARLDADKVP